MSDEARQNLSFELAQLDSQVESVTDALERATHSPEHASHLGYLLHGFYNGFEKCLRFVLEIEGKSVPRGDRSHANLLAEFESTLGDTFGDVKELLGFRHRFRNSYAGVLDYRTVQSLAGKVPLLWAKLRPLLVTRADRRDTV